MLFTTIPSMLTPVRRPLCAVSRSLCSVISNKQRLVQLLQEEKLSAYIIPSSDPHLSEYTAKAYERRQFLTGFTGSAGTAVVLRSGEGYLWTDGRYFQQAEMELSDEWQLMRSGEKGVPSMVDMLSSSLQPSSVVGIDPTLHSASDVSSLKKSLAKKGIDLKGLKTNLVDILWKDNRPDLPSSPIRIHPSKYSGQSIADKLTAVRNKLLPVSGKYALILTELDEIAWIFNIRSGDVPFNPLLYAFAIVSNDEEMLFVNESKLDSQSREFLQSNGIDIFPYTDFHKSLETLTQSEITAFIDKETANHSVCSVIPEAILRNIESPVSLLKACKNRAEVDGMTECHRRDGGALIHFMCWLKDHLHEKQYISEVDIDIRLTDFRKLYSPSSFIGRSFDTIAGVNENGAIIHYSAKEGSCKHLSTGDLLLLDSGGQYADGTTDVTRTIATGDVDPVQADLYTRVLMGHIDLASASFPTGTTGGALDSLARRHLWDVGWDYAHGTGHGVGAALCVHEGPQRIGKVDSKRSGKLATSQELLPGMIVSIEPGVYKAGSFGIRLENLYIVEEGRHGFMTFRPLTLVPFERKLLKTDMLSNAQVLWLNSYHDKVKLEISPLLKQQSHVEWLLHACEPVSNDSA